MNLSETQAYDFFWNWVYKQRSDKHITEQLFVYVDGGRPVELV